MRISHTRMYIRNHRYFLLLSMPRQITGYSQFGFSSGNKRPIAKVWQFKSFCRFTVLPDQSSQSKGVVRLAFRAHTPNFIGKDNANWVGAATDGSGAKPFAAYNNQIDFA